MKDLILTVVIFSLIGLFSVYEVATYPSSYSKNVWDVLFVAFAGPSISDDSLFNLIFWFLPYLMFFYMFGNTAEEELSQRGVSIIPLIGSRRKWWLGEIATLLILSIIYVLIGIATVLIVSLFFLPLSNEISPFLLSLKLWQIPKDTTVVTLMIRWVFLLFGSTLFALSFIQMALSVIWRNSFTALILVCAVMILSWLFGIRHPYLVRWLPGSQSMLLRHTFLDPTVYGFSLMWSLVYNAIIVLIILAVSFIYVRRMDIFKKISEIHKEA
ncbi:MAG: hypothetical protein ACP5SP_07470 [Caldisericum sp.]|uniref:hypothetical protein n=1 Tax=Caldisericum sp. TaxID=2499687 RepID=UPI003D1532B9